MASGKYRKNLNLHCNGTPIEITVRPERTPEIEKQYFSGFADKLDYFKGFVRKASLSLSLAIVLTPKSIGPYPSRMRTDYPFLMDDASVLANRMMLPERNVNLAAGALAEATWASEQLNIPRAFILAHWMEESGFKYPSTENYNLGGIFKNGRIMRFDSLHDFAKQYVKTMKADGVSGMVDFWGIVGTIQNHDYNPMESRLVYGNKILGTMRNLIGIIPEAKDYYNMSVFDRRNMLRK